MLKDLRRFAFITMLTPDVSNQGCGRTSLSRAKAGTKRRELVEFLEACLREGRRDVGLIQGFMSRSPLLSGIDLVIYGEDQYLTREGRGEYFENIATDLLDRSLILVDPDVGLEVPSMRRREEQYVRYDEILSIYQRMTSSSVLMIFQFIPRVKRLPYIRFIARGLKCRITEDVPVAFITDGQVVFFLLAGSSSRTGMVAETIGRYARRYDLCWGKI